MRHLENARAYLAAIEAGDDVATKFYAPEIVQREFPNRLVPDGATRDLAALRLGAERGKHTVSAQHYEVVSAIEQDDRLALEVIWTATVAVPIGKLAPGATMRARFGVFLKYRDGRIVEQHNYDCFDPF